MAETNGSVESDDTSYIVNAPVVYVGDRRLVFGNRITRGEMGLRLGSLVLKGLVTPAEDEPSAARE